MGKTTLLSTKMAEKVSSFFSKKKKSLLSSKSHFCLPIYTGPCTFHLFWWKKSVLSLKDSLLSSQFLFLKRENVFLTDKMCVKKVTFNVLHILCVNINCIYLLIYIFKNCRQNGVKNLMSSWGCGSTKFEFTKLHVSFQILDSQIVFYPLF